VGVLVDDQGETKPGERLTVSDKEVGTITSAVFSPALQRPIAFAYLQREHWAPGYELTIRRNGSRIHARVAALPFVKGTASTS
jgi:glycine cleavage system aminomethyltransferase T